MKNIYVKFENKDNNHIWVKFIMEYNNELRLDNIVMSINQMLINNKPINVFFEYPNILFEKVTPLLYINNSSISKIKEITTKDVDCAYDIHCSSYRNLKETIYGMIGKGEKSNEENIKDNNMPK